MNVILLVLVFAAGLLLELRRVQKQGNPKELAVLLIFVLFSFSLALLQVLGVSLPNPSKGIELLVRKMTAVKFGYGQ